MKLNIYVNNTRKQDRLSVQRMSILIDIILSKYSELFPNRMKDLGLQIRGLENQCSCLKHYILKSVFINSRSTVNIFIIV